MAGRFTLERMIASRLACPALVAACVLLAGCPGDDEPAATDAPGIDAPDITAPDIADRHRHHHGAGPAARGLRAYATRRATDASWTASTGLGGGSFATRGVLVAVFAHGTMPIAGVQIRASGVNVDPATTFTFSDTGATRATAVAQPEVTGANGTVLVIGQPAPVPFDGAGGEPASWQWPSSLAATIPGTVFVQHKLAQTVAGAPCP